LQVGLLSSIANKPLSRATSILAVSVSSFVVILDNSRVMEVIYRNSLLADVGWHRLPWSRAWAQRQVPAHNIDNHGHKHQHNANPETPITMRTFPVRNITAMNTVMLRLRPMVATFAHLQPSLLSHCLQCPRDGVVAARLRPHPVQDLRQILPVLVNVVLVLYELVPNRLL